MGKQVGLKIRTLLSYEDLEDVLQRTCKGKFSISLEGMDGPQKVMILAFDSEQDRDAARAAIKKK